MNENLLEVRYFDGEGYRPLIDYGAWRVAVLRYLDELQPDKIATVERHMETDEVFILLKGQAILFVGEGEPEVDELHTQVMDLEKVYNIKKGIWHTIVMSKDATVLIVENQDTGRPNSEYCDLQPEHRTLITETARQEQPDWWK
jgi:ureidoglycolate hydrolase